MKRRYTICPRRPRSDWLDENDIAYVNPPQPLTIYLDDDKPEETGLFDAQGNELFRTNERDQIGFLTGVIEDA
jgi:hypothetical protein